MTTDTSYVETLRSEFREMCRDADGLFSSAKDRINELKKNVEPPITRQERFRAIRRRLTDFGPRLVEAIRKSALLDKNDEAEIRRSLRSIAASLQLREFTYEESHVVYGEEGPIGIKPEEQSEISSNIGRCHSCFRGEAHYILDKFDFLAPTPENLTRAIVSSQMPGVQKSRSNLTPHS